VIKQGDHLALLAYKFGFDADTVWNDPKNAQLRQAGHLSQDPNILYPTDVLYIPGQNVPPVMKRLAPGTTNTFISTAPVMTLTHKFVAADPTTYMSKAYTVQELDQLTGLTTDANGVVTFQVPVTLETATIVFTDTGEAWALRIGAMDPINTLSGIFLRLQNLGYIGSEVQFDGVNPLNNLTVLRGGLRALKASQGAGPSSTSAPSSEPSAPSSTPHSGPGEATPPPVDSAPASVPPPNSVPPPSSAPTSNPGNGGTYSCRYVYAWFANGASDNDGLADDGTLDPDTQNLLVQAYGC
jgi:hypothetical protein